VSAVHKFFASSNITRMSVTVFLQQRYLLTKIAYIFNQMFESKNYGQTFVEDAPCQRLNLGELKQCMVNKN